MNSNMHALQLQSIDTPIILMTAFSAADSLAVFFLDSRSPTNDSPLTVTLIYIPERTIDTIHLNRLSLGTLEGDQDPFLPHLRSLEVLFYSFGSIPAKH